MWGIFLKWVSENWGWAMPLALYGLYWLRYFIKREPLQTGLYNNLIDDLRDFRGPESAMREKIEALEDWRGFYRNSLDGLLAFFDQWFGEGVLTAFY